MYIYIYIIYYQICNSIYITLHICVPVSHLYTSILCSPPKRQRSSVFRLPRLWKWTHGWQPVVYSSRLQPGKLVSKNLIICKCSCITSKNASCRWSMIGPLRRIRSDPGSRMGCKHLLSLKWQRGLESLTLIGDKTTHQHQKKYTSRCAMKSTHT